jgi:hypothetical protein
MKIYIKALFILIIALWQQSVHGMTPATGDSIRFEVLLNRKMLDDIHMDVKFTNSLNVTPGRLILLSSANQFYLLGWGGIKPVGQKVTGTIRSFAYTPNGLLMTVHDKELCYIDSLGKLAKFFTLPDSDMGIAAGRHVMYLYGRNKEQKDNALYVLAKGHKYAKLLVIPTPIMSVVEMKNGLIFATENKLFSLDIISKEIKALAALAPKENEIISMTKDTSGNTVYFSTKNAIYVLKDSSIICMSDKLGGVLRYSNNALIVFNTERNTLILFAGIEKMLALALETTKSAPEAAQPTKILTNSSIINLVKNKYSDSLIILTINSSTVDFNLSVDSIIELSNQNVSSAVILAMKQAMRKQNIQAPQK